MSKKHRKSLKHYSQLKQSSEPLKESVHKSLKSVEKRSNNSGKSVDKTVEAGEKDAKNYAPTVEKSPRIVQKSAKNSVDNPADLPKKVTSDHTESSAAIAIKVTDLRKGFRLPTERANGLKQAIFNHLKGIKGYTEHQVLRGINFEVKKGEFLGIVGRNGSGKSTLLKLLAQIYRPDSGTIEINGTLVPFIELGVGFNPELTGRENVYLNGALLGFSNKEMDDMYDEIVRFAELEQFMDAKLKNYSSGMQVRLAFSIAIRAHGDILILDEVLAVGDAEFQQKCHDYFAGLHGTQTVVLVTHSMQNVREFCDRAILIENGEIATEGAPDEVATAYENLWS